MLCFKMKSSKKDKNGHGEVSIIIDTVKEWTKFSIINEMRHKSIFEATD